MRITFALLALFPLTASACLWDHDTLRQERSRFPDVLELITGKFLRHSPEFYEWRVKDRLAKLGENPSNLGYLDDLAVAYHKTGRHDLAVETILKKEKIAPGQYTTYSNLGTFYILAGELEKGLPYIDKALAIDPDAHFGREKYQKWLVEYAISKKKGGKLEFPLWTEEGRPGRGFAAFVAARIGTAETRPLEDSQPAVKAVLGMMRFADHDNPLLLEALGDLLLAGHYPERDAKRLAARAYLVASYKTEGATSSAYRELARVALEMQQRPVLGELPLAEVEGELKNQRADADRWYAALTVKERRWIDAGLDADAEFDKLYTRDPVSPGDDEVMEAARDRGVWIIATVVAVLLGLAAGAVYAVRRFYRWWLLR